MQKFIILFLLIFINSTFAQTKFFTPEEIIKTYRSGTRSEDGNPGKNYWQNKSEYAISVFLNTKEKKIEGKESISYHNNSPDNLNQIVFRMYQDFAIATKSRDWEVGPNDFTNGVSIKVLIINGVEINLSDGNVVQRPGTNMIVKLNNPLLSKSINDIYAEWSFQIPNQDFPRMGEYDSTTYMIAYWYPQIAVYDDIDGWDYISYTGSVEFYNDISDFDVKISSDRENLIVWATGVLQNPEEVFSENILKKYRLDSGNVISLSDIQSGMKFLKNGVSTVYHYKAVNVPDFVFSTSDHYIWDRETAETDPGKFTRINAAYNPDSHWFTYVSKIAKKIILFLSNELPGIPFPYPSMTIFNGDGGMEYPMMVNDGTTDDWPSTVYLTSHETSHTYFPFFMGTNERKYGWMDEGWATYLPMEFQNKLGSKNPESNVDTVIDVKARSVNFYLRVAGTFYDVPALAPSNVLKSPSYRNNAYSKAAAIYDILRDMLGDEVFKKCLKEYISRWKGKHPNPYDFFNTFSNVSGKDLNWFWQKWFMEYAKPDLGIKSATTYNNILNIIISNEGGLPLPIELTIKLANNKIIKIHKTAEVWKDGNNTFTIKQSVDSNLGYIFLGNEHIPDVNKKNNSAE